MQAIIKTWPSSFTRSKTLDVFTHPWAKFYFTLGRGKPAKPVDTIFYTHDGEILGHFTIEEIVQNDGTNLPKLRSITNDESAWQIRPGNWVAVCPQPFFKLDDERLYHSGFRGWRYFDLEKYRGSLDAKVRL